MPFFAVLIAALLIGSGNVVPIAILAAGVGWILAVAARRMTGAGADPAAPAQEARGG